MEKRHLGGLEVSANLAEIGPEAAGRSADLFLRLSCDAPIVQKALLFGLEAPRR